MNFKATLPFPPSINHYWRRGQRATYLSTEGRKYRENVLKQVKSPVVLFPRQRLHARITLHPSNKRQFDIDNRPKGLLDALEKANIYANDNQIDHLQVIRGEIAKEAHCIVELKVIGDE